MDKEYANEILACLPQERTCYHYFKDRYALQLLGYAAGNGTSVDALRRSPYGKLMNKPGVRQMLADCGDGRVERERIDAQWQTPLLPFLLTAGLWGHNQWQRYHQTSRPGFNLVLRLNFSHDHDRHFRKMFSPYYWDDTLNWSSAHPVMKDNERRFYRQTLAWARLDVDMENGEALVEEIQTDWVRNANKQRRRLPNCGQCKRQTRNEVCRKVESARRYLDVVFSPYAAVWDEAMLSAALFFLHEELGLSRVWYHTWRTGIALKGIDPDWAPPRSLYEKLPRRFCFSETDNMPKMLYNRASRNRLRKAKVEPRFYQLKM